LGPDQNWWYETNTALVIHLGLKNQENSGRHARIFGRGWMLDGTLIPWGRGGGGALTSSTSTWVTVVVCFNFTRPFRPPHRVGENERHSEALGACLALFDVSLRVVYYQHRSFVKEGSRS
jgi:hypothetical protein